MEENLEKKVNFIKVYEHILQNEFHVSSDRIHKIRGFYESYLDKFENEVIKNIVDDVNDAKMKELYDLFNENIKNLFLHNFSKMIKEVTYGYEPRLAYEGTRINDLLNIGIEYSYLLLKHYKFDEADITRKLRSKLSRNVEATTLEKALKMVKDHMINATHDNIYFKDNSSTFLNTILENLGNEKIRDIYDYNLRHIDNYEIRDIEFNFSANAPSYDNIMFYDTEKDITFFKYNDNIYKAYGKYENFDDFLNQNLEFKNHLEDYEKARVCVSINPVGFCRYQADNALYYYSINGQFYKSEIPFDDDEIRQQFDRVLNFMERVPRIDELLFGNVCMVNSNYTPSDERLEQIRNYSKLNIANTLENIRRYTNVVDENKKNANFVRLKEMYIAYKNATDEKLSRMTGWGYLKKIFVYLPYKWSISSLKSDIKATLHMTEREFETKIKVENTTKFETNSYDILKNHQELVKNISKNKEYSAVLPKYLTKEVKEEFNIDDEKILNLKYKISPNIISEQIKEYEFTDDLDLDVFDYTDEIKEINNDGIKIDDNIEFDDFLKEIDNNNSLDKIDTNLGKEKVFTDPTRLPIKGLNSDLVAEFNYIFDKLPNIAFIQHYTLYIYSDLKDKGEVDKVEAFELASAVYNIVFDQHEKHMVLTDEQKKYVNALANEIISARDNFKNEQLNHINNEANKFVNANDKDDIDSLVNNIKAPDNLSLKTYSAKLLEIGPIDNKNVKIYASFLNETKSNEFVCHYTKYVYEHRFSLGRNIDIAKAYSIANYLDEKINNQVHNSIEYDRDIDEIAKPIIEKINKNVLKVTSNIKNIVVEEIKNDNQINDLVNNVENENKELNNEKNSKM